MTIVGRHVELAGLERFLVGTDSALLVCGEMGIGKTALWEQGLALADSRGHQVLTTRATGSEAGLGPVGLVDLLEDVLDDVEGGLVAVQRRALRVALLREGPGDQEVDPRCLATASMHALRLLAERGPVLVAIDDLAWLDPATTRVLAFALRRLTEAPVRLLATVRVADGEDLPPLLTDDLAHRQIGMLRPRPLSRTEIRAVIGSALGAATPGRPTLQAIVDTSGGNPYLALELGRAVAEGREIPSTGGIVPAPPKLQRLLGDRLDALSAAARHVALLVALAPRTPVAAIGRGVDGDTDGPIEQLVTAGIVQVRGDDLELTHPLLRSVLAERADEAERRAAHARLADVAPDRFARAVHRARAEVRPRRAIAAELDDLARQAVASGLPHRALELAELAVLSTPVTATDDGRTRRLRVADLRFATGDPLGARELAAVVVGELDPGPRRAPALERLAAFQRYGMEPIDTWSATLAQALNEADPRDAGLRIRLHYAAGVAAHNRECPMDAAVHLRAVAELAERLADPVAKAQWAAATIWSDLVAGAGVRNELVAIVAAGRSDARVEVETRATYTAAVALTVIGDLDGARELLVRDHAEAAEVGDEAALSILSWPLALVELWAGDLERATAVVEQGGAVAALVGTAAPLAFAGAAAALVHGTAGNVDSALAEARAAIEIGERAGLVMPCWIAAWGGAVASLAARDPSQAWDLLERYAAKVLADGIPEPALAPWVPDGAEALVRCGDLAAARSLLDPFAVRAEQLGRTRCIVAARRTEALILSGEGRQSAALATIDAAGEAAGELGMAFETGRTLLVAAEVHRRARRHRRARHSLEEARAAFLALGARGWAATCDSMLGGGVPALAAELTAAEATVARLAADGLTTRAISSVVFCSARTVETHLQRVYRKLGVRSRVELTRVLMERTAGTTDVETGAGAPR